MTHRCPQYRMNRVTKQNISTPRYKTSQPLTSFELVVYLFHSAATLTLDPTTLFSTFHSLLQATVWIQNSVVLYTCTGQHVKNHTISTNRVSFKEVS